MQDDASSLSHSDMAHAEPAFHSTTMPEVGDIAAEFWRQLEPTVGMDQGELVAGDAFVTTVHGKCLYGVDGHKEWHLLVPVGRGRRRLHLCLAPVQVFLTRHRSIGSAGATPRDARI